ncbi:L-threonylcarbamoyladenylate synthase [Stenomitos frigidus]|uniref:Threonylcarbamoyl-AMP synthase n=1 Tax=Stenomitos frigidus ULC18 TaxID=2107698 RepID=A0A2T1DXZ8_9CYAN|nr:L-threonylcarbamoyladenylate synthase [Stenomitos frigidus]PSB25339.1 threonylcarbamoyl-AMP synthase [Stenomitos frigidus ULC18]
MSTLFSLHPDNPQTRVIDQIVDALRGGAVMLYPTDTVYAIGCDLNSKSAIQRVRQIKQLSNDKPLTFLCPSLSDIAQYAVVSDPAYRIMRRLIPGPYTFLLPTTKLVPKLVMSPKRKATGIRVPDHPLCLALMNALGNPIISTSAHMIADDATPNKGKKSGGNKTEQEVLRFELFDCLEKLVDVIVDSGTEPGYHVSTILDLTGEEPIVVRRGLGWEAVAAWAVETG